MEKVSNIDVHSISSSEASIARKRRMEIIHHQKIQQGKRHRDGSGIGIGIDIRSDVRSDIRSDMNNINKNVVDAQLISSSDDDEQYCPSSGALPSSLPLSLPLPPKKRKVSVEMLNTLASVSVAAAASTSVVVVGEIQEKGRETAAPSSPSSSSSLMSIPTGAISPSSSSNMKIKTTTRTTTTTTTKHQTNQTKQKRYEPETPMTKEQTAAWRREARKVRNRQSAAKSREKIKSRINVLELEVKQWKTKYEQVFQRLQELEKDEV
eukprot:CAMPEP_0203669652 /NCGR_PEP_ID=MMETSP0090-20130426/5955_1 /ASSEMBLY_ACC=CAM_ASM_001088 /TAXON_ID=426623 /ORGANISM="Chaetoceros affinis, Strain CCMP159" /LENGTH=264 /DNA_ID=CAMNT_0050534379 /DNA_START=261 /DNA_END=1052 /DNA_ORIENTATION=+